MVTSTLILAAEEETHNPLIPAVPDLVWGTVCFVIVFVFFWKFVLPRLQKMLDDRSAEIEGSIEAAQKQQAEASEALEHYAEQLAEARQEAAKIRETARNEGQQILVELKAQAQAEAERISQNAQVQIAADRKAAFSELKSEIGILALDLASSIVGDSLADDKRSQAVVERFLADLDGASK